MNKNISIQGAREHNLKNINVKIPRDKLTIITKKIRRKSICVCKAISSDDAKT